MSNKNYTKYLSIQFLDIFDSLKSRTKARISFFIVLNRNHVKYLSIKFLNLLNYDLKLTK